MWFRAATAFEYFNDPVQAAESRDPTGTMSTVGDVGYLDEKGYLYLTDRGTYMITSGGAKSTPAPKAWRTPAVSSVSWRRTTLSESPSSAIGRADGAQTGELQARSLGWREAIGQAEQIAKHLATARWRRTDPLSNRVTRL